MLFSFLYIFKFYINYHISEKHDIHLLETRCQAIFKSRSKHWVNYVYWINRLPPETWILIYCCGSESNIMIELALQSYSSYFITFMISGSVNLLVPFLIHKLIQNPVRCLLRILCSMLGDYNSKGNSLPNVTRNLDELWQLLKK